MIIVNRVNDVISGSYNNEPFGISYNEDIYKKMKNLEDKSNNVTSYKDLQELYKEFETLTKEDLTSKIEKHSDNIYVNKGTGEFFLKVKEKVSSVAMPKALVDRIIMSIEKNIDINPLIKCWTLWLRNPVLRGFSKEEQIDFSNRFFNFIDIQYTNENYVEKLMEEKGYSRSVAESMATTYSVKITQEGLIAAYKVSKEITTRWRLDKDGNPEEYSVYDSDEKTIDPISGLITSKQKELQNEDRIFKPAVWDNGDEFYCGENLGYIIKVGETHKLPDWSYVNTNSNTSCVKGLHVGGLDYIRGYQQSGTETHNIFISPEKIGAIPNDNKGAIRCLEYFVKDAFSGVNGSIYHSSTYGEKLDKEWENYKIEVIESWNKALIDYAKNNKNHTEEINSI